MGLARDLVALETKLRQLGARVFGTEGADALLATAETDGFISHLRARGFAEPEQVIKLCLQALRVQHEELQPKLLDAELVATLPPSIPGLARTTEQVARTMIGSSVKEIVLLGYEVTDADLVQLLAESAARGVDVVMICDRQRGGAERVRELWPSDKPLPRVYCDRDRADQAPYASMHAKCLLVDGQDLLITSANFTFHGLHGNIEIGVRLKGSPAAEARKIFSSLVESGLLKSWDSD